MPNEILLNDWLGTATISPGDPVVAGSIGTWKVVYTVGRSAIDDGGRIRLAFRSVCDHGIPQFGQPGLEGYTTITSSASATLTPVYGVEGIRPWSKTVTIRVSQGQLREGDQVTITLGDRSFGSPGIRAETYPERNFAFQLLVDPFGTAMFEQVASLEYEVIGGPATQLVVVAPSDAVAGTPGWVQVRALDQWGNPDPAYNGIVRFDGVEMDGIPTTYRFTAGDAGVHRFDDVQFHGNGFVYISATDDERRLQATSNPIRMHARPPAVRTFWGDIHGQTRETVGTGSIEDYFRYARDIAAVDACAHSGNDFQITTEVYAELRARSQHFHEPGRFVTFHGYEWSGNTPAGGDHNVYYLDDGPIRRSSHTQVDDRHDLETDCYPIDRLYAANAGRDDVLITPHIGGRRANLDYHDPALEPAIEIASQWGRFEWFAREAISRGMKVGFIGGSDDHSGRPGWSTPTLAHHGVRGGLTAYRAPELTREEIWHALRNRQVYGTSGARILLDVQINGAPIGSMVTSNGPANIGVSVAGTAGLDTIELRRGLETIHTVSLLPEPQPDEQWKVRIAWRGARNRDRTRSLDWTGGVDVQNGRILAATNHAIDSPLDGVSYLDGESVRWRSHTCGDWDGVILDMDGNPDTQLRFNSPTMSFDISLSDLSGGPVTKTGNLLEQQVVVQRLSALASPWTASFEFQDIEAGPGEHAYWIWVTQSDGELAWSSPVFVSQT